jgi:uncharacterized protein
VSDRYGPWAVIAGGSEGIDAEVCNRLAGGGVNMALIARNAGALESQAHHLASTYGVEVRQRPLDLAASDAVADVVEFAKGLNVGFYARVASYAPLDPYLDTSSERHRQALAVNVLSAHELTHHFASAMTARGSGGILLCSSMASLTPFRTTRSTPPTRHTSGCSARRCGTNCAPMGSTF